MRKRSKTEQYAPHSPLYCLSAKETTGRKPEMKLYTFDAAPNPARLGMFMQYKGISLDTVQIDLGAEEQLGEAYRAIVPEATVPALVLDDGTVLCSVIAIAHYLESQYPDKPLLGRTPEERARVLNWNHRLYSDIFAAAADAFRNGHPNYVDRALPGPVNVAQLPELVERGRTTSSPAWKSLTRRWRTVLSLRATLSPSPISICWRRLISQNGAPG